MLPDLSAHLIRRHVSGVYDHQYLNGYHTTIVHFRAWSSYAWAHGQRKQALIVPREGATVAQLEGFLKLAGLGTDVLVELVPDSDLEKELTATGRWKLGYALPVNVMNAETVSKCRHVIKGEEIREVTDAQTRTDFCHIQDIAYAVSYDMPKGCASLLFTPRGALIGPDVLALVLYLDDKPVRTGMVIRAHGLVSGLAGATLPAFRGGHSGEPLIRYFLDWMQPRGWGDFLLHETMPVALHIPKRLGCEQVAIYNRWTPA